MSMMFHNPRFRVVNSSGVPYNAARLFAYTTGTATPQNTYSDSTLLSANTNPVVSNNGGLFGAIYLDQSLSKYKLVCKTSVADGDETLWTIDPYENDNDGNFTGELTVTGDIRTGGIFEAYSSTPKIYLSETDQGSNLKNWEIILDGGVLTIRTKTDADGAGKDILKITRGATTAISAIAIGNATDVPTITLNGTTLVAASIIQPVTGSFTATLTGVSGTVTGTIYYTLHNNIVHFRHDGAAGLFGTSNATTMTMTGLPAACQPADNTRVPCIVTDNTLRYPGYATFNASSGTVDFSYAPSAEFTDVYTNSGTKGFYLDGCCFPLS